MVEFGEIFNEEVPEFAEIHVFHAMWDAVTLISSDAWCIIEYSFSDNDDSKCFKFLLSIL